MASMLRRGGSAAALAAAVAIVLSGCIVLPPAIGPGPGPGGGSGPTTSPDGSGLLDFTPTGEDVDAALEPYYGQDVDWTLCDAGYTCGTIDAPMDWFAPEDGRSIEVSMIVRPADGEVWGSMLYNPGGPGGSGLEYVRDYAEYLLAPEVLEHYNLVGFDPRGVGQSTPITCYDDPAFLYDYLYEIPEGPAPEPLSDEDLQQQLDAGAEFADACLQFTGEALEFMGTEQAASDMDLIRALLGEERLQYLGVSYGTLLGATYADLFPQHVGRFVLDAAVAPDASDADGTIFQAGGFELALRNWMADCLSVGSCPFDAPDADAGMQQIGAFLDGLEAAPLPASDGRQLGSSSMFTAIAANLYSPSQWSTLRSVFADAIAGDPDSALAESDRYYGVNPDGTFADNSFEALIGVNCLDAPPVTDFEDVRANATRIQEVAPTLWEDFTGMSICASWPFEATREPHVITAPGAEPIVVIGGRNDPATPYEQSVSLADQLESGVLISVDAEGHSQYNLGNACVDEPVNAYFLTGAAPTDDLDC
ncbi:alpha/beta hydrolase [Agrococcus versicolor]|uniref:Alpha/beta hydrolase n=1 Tax=Agrococcus versicolor TaxID=501482 RepID=A0ABN3ALM8_9MICO